MKFNNGESSKRKNMYVSTDNDVNPRRLETNEPRHESKPFTTEKIEASSAKGDSDIWKVDGTNVGDGELEYAPNYDAPNHDSH